MGWWPDLALIGVLPVCWEALFATLRLAGAQPAVLTLRMSCAARVLLLLLPPAG